MKKIKTGLAIFVVLPLISLILAGIIFAQTNPLEGKLIALDAGHGGTELGATYPPNSGESGQVKEKDVNLAVVYTLKNKLEINGAKVVLTGLCDETIASRKERVDWAVEECKRLGGRKCDALVSVHHNGNTDISHDGTMVIYNEKQDIPLAKALHDTLIQSLDLPDEGYAHGGYGMTVYDHLVSVITEAYYITNTQEAEYYLAGTSTEVCANTDGSQYSVLIGDRINQEADALYQGLFNYFSAPPKKPGRR